MKYLFVFSFLLLLFSCETKEEKIPFSTVEIETIYEDSLSVRAIELIGTNLSFAANDGFIGNIDLNTNKVYATNQKYDSIFPEFRTIAHTTEDVFVLSAGSPALLYKTGDNGKFELVYKEEGDEVFYDAMTFYNDTEGIAIGDSMNGCMSILITRDGGNTWNKQDCSSLPEAIDGEGAFAASNTNIKIVGDKTWVATTNGTILYSSDKGKSWEAIMTNFISKKATQGIYSIDFYDENLGFAIGGDFTQPDATKANKAITTDAGKTWQLVADQSEPGYKSCVQFVPNDRGLGLVAVGFTGISYSTDMGTTWKQLSDEGFYTLRFKNDSVAYAAGKGGVSKLTFR
ncbi:oxidoreductase [Cellulophaga baltica]|uniref:WD40/YVTN/BNR-like repeat-containing protein n=1 Tax=Cellulophaga TaxID=104264 RepID=UPI001C06FC27|nr:MULTISPECIES: YCF48-related protein [Cellulophaga]MBU2997383.1 oxidoreductase [Cellulophaga baltica]MDO6768780.1 YCF48-related protein [Cellulophaga sp. 1_MG-2023]